MSYTTRNNNTVIKDKRGLYDPLVNKSSGKYMPENTPEERRKARLAADDAARKVLEAAKKEGKDMKKAQKEAVRAQKKVYANLVPKDTLRYKALMSHYAGRSPEEIGSTRSTGRLSEALLSGLDGGTLRLWSPKDNDDIVGAKKYLATVYLKDLLGMEIMSDKNKQAMKWLIETTEGQKFPKPDLGMIKLQVIGEDGNIEEREFSLDSVLAELDDEGEVEFGSDIAVGKTKKQDQGARKKSERQQESDNESESTIS